MKKDIVKIFGKYLIYSRSNTRQTMVDLNSSHMNLNPLWSAVNPEKHIRWASENSAWDLFSIWFGVSPENLWQICGRSEPVGSLAERPMRLVYLTTSVMWSAVTEMGGNPINKVKLCLSSFPQYVSSWNFVAPHPQALQTQFMVHISVQSPTHNTYSISWAIPQT